MILTEWHAEQWSALGSMVTAAVAVVAAVFAAIQVLEARRLREEQSKPFVIVDIQPSPTSRHILNLVIENTGTTMARDVKITFTPGITTTMRDEFPLEDSSLLKDGIPMLPPGRRLDWMFDSSVKRHEQRLPLRYEVEVAYADQRGRAQEPLHFPIDLAPLYGVAYVEEKGLHHIAKALEGLQKTTKSWTARGRLGVSVHDEDEQHAAARRYEAVMGRRQTLSSPRPPEKLMWAAQWRPALWLIRAWRNRRSPA